MPYSRHTDPCDLIDWMVSDPASRLSMAALDYFDQAANMVRGPVRVSHDDWVTWTEVAPPVGLVGIGQPHKLPDGKWVAVSAVIPVGQPAVSRPTVLVTSTDGVTWSMLPNSPAAAYVAVSGTTLVITVGSYESGDLPVMESRDEGITWFAVSDEASEALTGDYLNSVDGKVVVFDSAAAREGHILWVGTP